MIHTKKTGPFDIWTAWDDYFWYKSYPSIPTGYGTTREEALGSLSAILSSGQVAPKHTLAPVELPVHHHNWTKWTMTRQCKGCNLYEHG